MADSEQITRALAEARTQDDRTLGELSEEGGLLVVFLRHGGCTFCRRSLADLARDREWIESRGIRIVLVHMDPLQNRVALLFATYGLDDVARVSDPDRRLYRAFDLSRGTIGQLFGPSVLARGLKAAVVDGHGMGRPIGDVLQMPGAFIVHRGRVVRADRPRTAADATNYCDLVEPSSAGHRGEASVDPAAQVSAG